jgi:hypothetical protein
VARPDAGAADGRAPRVRLSLTLPAISVVCRPPFSPSSPLAQARQCVRKVDAKQILQNILDTYEGEWEGAFRARARARALVSKPFPPSPSLPPPGACGSAQSISLKTVISDLVLVLEPFQFTIKAIRSEHDGQVYFTFMTKEFVDVERGQGSLGGVFGHVFLVIFDHLTTKEEPISIGEAKGLQVKAQAILTAMGAPGVEAGAGAGAGGASTAKARAIKPAQWLDALRRLINERWLIATADGLIYLGPRASAELAPRLAALKIPPCLTCKTSCVTPDPEALAGQGKRHHIACFNKTLDKALADDEPLFPQSGKVWSTFGADDDGLASPSSQFSPTQSQTQSQSQSQTQRGRGGGKAGKASAASSSSAAGKGAGKKRLRASQKKDDETASDTDEEEEREVEAPAEEYEEEEEEPTQQAKKGKGKR